MQDRTIRTRSLRAAAATGILAVAGGCAGFGDTVDDSVGKEGGSLLAGAAGFGLAKLAGADTGTAIAAGVAAAAFTWASVEASRSDKLEAENEALRQKQKMTEDELAKLKEENRKLAVKVNDEGGRMIVEPETGKPVNDKVYTIEDETPEEGTLGELDGYSVVFAG